MDNTCFHKSITGTFIVHADIKVNSLLEKAGNNYLFKVGEVIGGQVQMYQEKESQN